MSIEYHYQWYKKGANGKPICHDKSRVYDFSGTSIEHIYPRNPAHSDQNESIEPLKNSLGNLTIMDTLENSKGDNDPFLSKKHLYQRSTVVLTQEIGNKTDWTVTEIESHQQSLIDAAIAIFIP